MKRRKKMKRKVVYTKICKKTYINIDIEYTSILNG